VEQAFQWLKSPQGAAFNQGGVSKVRETSEDWYRRLDEVSNSAQVTALDRSRLYIVLTVLGVYPYQLVDALSPSMRTPQKKYQYGRFSDMDVMRLIYLTNLVFTEKGTLRTDIMHFLTADDVAFIEWAAPQMGTNEHYLEYRRADGEATHEYHTRVANLCKESALIVGQVCPPFVARLQTPSNYGDSIANVVQKAKEKTETEMDGEPRRIAQLLVDHVLGTLLADSQRPGRLMSGISATARTSESGLRPTPGAT
jgi:hypothetical protein